MKHHPLPVATLLAALIVATSPARAATPPTRIAISAEPAGPNCPAGGQKIVIGADQDQDGTLDPGEIDSTSYVCNGERGGNGADGADGVDGTDGSDGAPGSDGTNGRSMLVRDSEEAPGEKCPYGGRRIDFGTDLDANGFLATGEVSATTHVCNGAPGAAGADGEDGLASIVRITVEPAGAYCAVGGQRLETGLDADRDATLEDDEVQSTAFLCNAREGEQGPEGAVGQDGFAALVSASNVAAGTPCAAGGTRLDAGIDSDRDGLLDAEEIDSATYVCHGERGEPGHSALVATEEEPAGETCPFGGSRLVAGTDADADGILATEEITAVSTLCHGGPGTNSLVRASEESPGGNCSAGGQRLDLGRDLNRNGTLGDGEVESTTYVCHGERGAQGPAGEGGCAGAPAGLGAIVPLLVAFVRRRRGL